MKKKILLIGAGFIGTNFYKLFKDKYDIVIADNLSYACTLSNGFWDMEKPNVYPINIFEGVDYTVKTENPDYIINMAADSHVDRSINESHSFLLTNVVGVENILKCIRNTNIRLLHFSTDEVYGDTSVKSWKLFKETDKLNPSSPYSASKAASDMLIKAYSRTYGVNVVTVRPTNNYGPYQYPEKLIPFLIKRKVEGKTLPIYGAGDNLREWLHVEDCCRAVELVLREGKSGEIYNIGSGHRLSNNHIAETIGGEVEHIEDRLGHDRRYAVDNNKVRSPGWEPKIEFEEGIKTTINWYSDRLDLIKSMSANSHIK